MRIGSLFSGIGGLELGLERAGVGHVVWQVEQNEYCQAVLAKHWPDAHRYDDVRTVGVANLQPVDVICGGFPCQDISQVGTTNGKQGLDGERSGLFYEYTRIVGELRPRYVVVENASALLFRGLGRVLGEFSEIGYDAEWHALPAAAVGAPHIRDRVWILAYARRELGDGERTIHRPRGSQRGGQEGNRRDAHQRGQDRELVALVAGIHPRVATDWWADQSRMARSAHGTTDWAHRVTALGNAVVPQVAEVVGRILLQIQEEIEAGAV